MSWTGEEDTGGSRFPVNDFVKKLQDVLNNIDRACHGYNGQVGRCCEGAQTCINAMDDTLATIKLAAIGNQSMHQACRTLSDAIGTASGCITDSTLSCHWSVDTEFILQPFHTTLDDIKLLQDEHCNNLPPEITSLRPTTTNITVQHRTSTQSTETTTTKAVPHTTARVTTKPPVPTPRPTKTPQPTKPPTTKPKPTTTPVEPTETETARSTSTEKHSTDSNDKSTKNPITSYPSTTTRKPYTDPALTKPSNSTTGPTNSTLPLAQQGTWQPENTIIIVASTVGALLIVALIVLFMIIRKRNQANENADSGGTFDSDQNRKSTLLRRLFPKSKTKDLPYGDNEIYEEIDEAFMEAVYKCGQENQKPKKEVIRERLSSATQVNVCYETAFDDNIIDSKDPVKSNSLGDKSMVSLSPLAFMRPNDEAITSFQTNKPNDVPRNSKPLPNQKNFMISKPSFTDIRAKEPDYVYIDACANEPIYAVPANEESEYDSAEYGRNPSRNIRQAPENIYSSLGEYKNTVEDARSAIDYNQVHHKEYRRSVSDVDFNFYENQDTMMEY